MAINWREAGLKLVPGWLREGYGGKLVSLIGLYADFIATGVSFSIRSSWLKDESSPYDALEPIGNERNTERYPGESNEEYRNRLIGSFDAWTLATTDQIIIEQLSILGFNPEIYIHSEWERPPINDSNGNFWWSKYYVVFDDNDLLNGPNLCGDPINAGEGYLCGVSGETELIPAIKGIIKKWKAAHEVVLVLIPDGGYLCGDGHLCGSGITAGGVVVELGLY